ncbi:MAG: hypothetical protein EOS20_26515 [Mesorhizobium sp.]|nr:MAG: hypothetical protein EOS20_26515 [Mesorhizobium sp.]
MHEAARLVRLPTALLPYCPTALLPYCPTPLLPYCLLPYSPPPCTRQCRRRGLQGPRRPI